MMPYLSGQVLQDGCRVDGSGGSHTSVRGGPVLEVTVDPAHWELKSCPTGTGLGLALNLAAFTTSRHGLPRV